MSRCAPSSTRWSCSPPARRTWRDQRPGPARRALRDRGAGVNPRSRAGPGRCSRCASSAWRRGRRRWAGRSASARRRRSSGSAPTARSPASCCASGLLEDGATVDISGWVNPHLELEVAVHLGEDTEIAGVSAAIELVERRRSRRIPHEILRTQHLPPPRDPRPGRPRPAATAPGSPAACPGRRGDRTAPTTRPRSRARSAPWSARSASCSATAAPRRARRRDHHRLGLRARPCRPGPLRGGAAAARRAERHPGLTSG